jgi:hypothetical protein
VNEPFERQDLAISDSLQLFKEEVEEEYKLIEKHSGELKFSDNDYLTNVKCSDIVHISEIARGNWGVVNKVKLDNRLMAEKVRLTR